MPQTLGRLVFIFGVRGSARESEMSKNKKSHYQYVREQRKKEYGITPNSVRKEMLKQGPPVDEYFHHHHDEESAEDDEVDGGQE
jgi:hypothetical protein